ncbi:MAG: YebC/PmpR family DNA-binding transcriptional regulator [Chloroflexi bacterium]|nr:YebC/PmpR family DNA-binding transcriptional regulator [Chloroflexota bacterium]
MSGHSKWANIKHAKGMADAKRGQMFTKLTREIMIAVREGGSSPESNFRLRLAVQKARDSNMPNDNIERAIKKGSGAAEVSALNELTLEGYAPGGAAVMVQALSDNRNRTIQEVRSIFTRHGGSLGESGCVSWLFESKGVIVVRTDNLDPDDLVLNAIDVGAEDVKAETGFVEIYTKPEALEKVRTALEQKGIPVQTAEVTMTPKTTSQLEEKQALQALKLIDRLEELDEVQSVSTNADFSNEILEKHVQQA